MLAAFYGPRYIYYYRAFVTSQSSVKMAECRHTNNVTWYPNDTGFLMPNILVDTPMG